MLFVFAVLILKHSITSFSTAQDSLIKDKTFCLRLKENPTLVLHQYFFMAIQVFQLNLTSAYSVYLVTSYYPQKALNILSLQRLDS